MPLHKDVQDADTVYFPLLCTLLQLIIYFITQFCSVFAQYSAIEIVFIVTIKLTQFEVCNSDGSDAVCYGTNIPTFCQSALPPFSAVRRRNGLSTDRNTLFQATGFTSQTVFVLKLTATGYVMCTMHFLH